jgi:hypothetical protein
MKISRAHILLSENIWTQGLRIYSCYMATRLILVDSKVSSRPNWATVRPCLKTKQVRSVYDEAIVKLQ